MEDFLQIHGTATGKKSAPVYGNIYVAALEASLFLKLVVTPTRYFRYLDDVFGVWSNGMNTLNQFMTLAFFF